MVGGIMKSLIKSGARDLKAKFSKRGDSEELDTPLNLRIGAAVDIDTLPLRMHEADLHIGLPEETILIVAQGFIDLGDGSYVHRYYAGNDTMIQVMTVNGTEDQHVEEITLFMPHQSYYPDGEGEWAQWTAKGGKLGAKSYRMDDGTEYKRIWFDTTDGYAEPTHFREYIYEDPESEECRENFQKAMLYGRNLQDGKKNEYLLLTVESYDGEQTVELFIGVDIDLSQLTII
jgi:hypothetical protein